MKYTFKNDESEKFPEMVHIDISTVCNFKCIHCPQGNTDKWDDSSKLMMKKEHFFKVVDEVSANGGILRITTDGEPLLHPNIKEFLNYVLNSNLYAATITTNGSLWSQELIDILMQPSKVKFVIDFSLDALYRDTYEKIRTGGNYLDILNKIFTIVETRNKCKASNIYVMVNAIRQPSVASEEIAAFEHFWSQIVDRVILRKYVDIQGIVGKLSGEMERFSAERWPCSLLWSRIMVNPKGDIRFCIDDWNNDSVFVNKNIDNTSIAEVWQNDEYRQLRENHLKRDFSHKLCRNCRNWEGLRWDYDYRVALQVLFSNDPNNRAT